MTISLRRLVAVIAVPATLTFALTACGTPSKGDLESELKKQGLSGSQAKCAADAVFNGGLSDKGLTSVLKADTLDEAHLSGDDKKAWDSIVKKIGECATQ